MNIAFFTDNQYRGGLDTFLISLINHWPNPEDELTLICNRSHPGLPVIESRLTRRCTIVAHRLPGHARWFQGNTSNALLRSRGGEIALSGLRRVLGYPLFATHVAALTLRFRQSRFDRLMVVNGGYPGSLTCRAASIAWHLAGKRPGAVHNFHNLARLSGRVRRPIDDRIDRMVRAVSSAFVSVSEACFASLSIRSEMRGAPGQVIYNGIAAPRHSQSARADVRSSLGIAPDAPVCLMLASYEPRKGHAFFFDAFRKVVDRVPNARAICCGDGTPEEIARVRALLAERGLVGKVFIETYRPDITPLIEATQALVIASQEFESFGLVIVEAMAERKPVVGTRVGGIPEVIGDAGVVCERDDVDGYADAIVTFLTDPVRAQEAGERGYERYRQSFTAERMAAEYATLLRSHGEVVAR